MQRILVTLNDCFSHPIVRPQVLESMHTVDWHRLVAVNLRVRTDELHVSLILVVSN